MFRRMCSIYCIREELTDEFKCNKCQDPVVENNLYPLFLNLWSMKNKKFYFSVWQNIILSACRKKVIRGGTVFISKSQGMLINELDTYLTFNNFSACYSPILIKILSSWTYYLNKEIENLIKAYLYRLLGNAACNFVTCWWRSRLLHPF